MTNYLHRLVFLLPSLLYFACPVHGQSPLAIGHWKTHLPLKGGHHISQNNEYVYYSTNFGLVRFDKDDLSVQFITKVNGLSDVRIRFAEINPVNQSLLVVYHNSNIDIVYADGSIINLDDIQRNENIAGDRTIFNVTFDDQGIAYLSTSFGIVALDMSIPEFRFTTFTKGRVNSVLYDEGLIYAGTESGIFRIKVTSEINLADFGLWTKVLDEQASADHLISFNGGIYFSSGTQIRRLANGFSIVTWEEDFVEINFLRVIADVLAAGINCTRIGQCSQHIRFFPKQGNSIFHTSNCVGNPLFILEDEKGRIWYADNNPGFRYAEEFTGPCTVIDLNTPFSENISEIAISKNRVFVASGGVTNFFGYLFRRDGFFILEDGLWKHFNVFNRQDFADNDLFDFFTIAPHPTQNLLYIGTFWAGLMEFDLDTEDAMMYDKFNSSLQGTVGDTARERVSGLAFDAEKNLWITNYLAARPISVYKNDGTWRNFSVPASTTISQVQVDQFGYKWFVVRGTSGGVLVFDSGNDIDNINDDRYRFFNSSNSALPTNTVNCIEVDLDGAVWVGTTEGPVVFECGSNIFDSGCSGFRKKVVQEGIVAYLLGTEDIQTIAVDGANRKWFGTRNGVFVQSADGAEEVHVFKENNSPLLNNTIIDIAINDISGEVFIGTNSGLISYRSNATAGGAVHESQVIAFPNPVRSDYSGPIAIKGLPRDANVKITDINGQLVFETTAYGGQAIWEGLDFFGNRVASGVYLVFSTSKSTFNTPDASVTKILFLK